MRTKVLGLIGFLVSVLLALTTLVYASEASAHPGEIARCNKGIKAKSVKLIRESKLQNGMYAEAYDTNGDKMPDVVAWSTVYGVEKKVKKGKEVITVLHAAFPTFYLVDLNADGYVDKIYVDKLGEGNCKDIVLYEDLTAPGKHEGIRGGYVNE